MSFQRHKLENLFSFDSLDLVEREWVLIYIHTSKIIQWKRKRAWRANSICSTWGWGHDAIAISFFFLCITLDSGLGPRHTLAQSGFTNPQHLSRPSFFRAYLQLIFQSPVSYGRKPSTNFPTFQPHSLRERRLSAEAYQWVTTFTFT